jgi:hypothetical protein
MEIIMKRTLFLSLITGLTALAATVAQADFFAYQKWVHPRTGNKVHLFFDVHNSSRQQQQKDFVNTVKQCGRDAVVLVEDNSCTMPDLSKDLTSKLMSITPLAGLYRLCKQVDINVVNIDERYYMDINGDVTSQYGKFEEKVFAYAKANDLYYDGAKKIFASLKQDLGSGDCHTPETDGEQRAMKEIGSMLLVDINILALIRAHWQKKDIFVVAGALHAANTAHMLFLCGYRPQETIIASELQLALKRRDENGLILNSFLEYLFDFKASSVEIYKTLLTIENKIAGHLSEYSINIREIFEAQLKSNDAEHKSVVAAAAAACAVPAQAVPAQALQPRSRL